MIDQKLEAKVVVLIWESKGNEKGVGEGPHLAVGDPASAQGFPKRRPREQQGCSASIQTRMLWGP